MFTFQRKWDKDELSLCFNIMVILVLRVFSPTNIWYLPAAKWTQKWLGSKDASLSYTCLVAQTVKNLLAMWETWVWPLGRKDPLEKEWQPTPVFLPGEFHGQRSLVGYSPWGHKELDTTEWLHFLSFSDVKSSFKLRKGHFSTVQFSERLPSSTQSLRPGVKQSHVAGLIGKLLYNTWQ